MIMLIIPFLYGYTSKHWVMLLPLEGEKEQVKKESL